MVTKIHVQPTSQHLTILEREIVAILVNIPTTLGGGNNGHFEIIMEPTEYSTMSGGNGLVNPLNPGFTQQHLQQLQQREPEPKQKQSTKSLSTNTRLSKKSIKEQKT
jgi:hypothetical protein